MDQCSICNDPVVTIDVGAWVGPGEYDIYDQWRVHVAQPAPGTTRARSDYDHDAEIGEV